MRHGSSTDDEVSSELELIDLALEQEKELHHATSYADCFKGVNFHRTMVAVGVQCLQQAQGNSFTTTYIVLFLQSLGVEDPLLIKTARACCSFAGALLAFYLTDKIGRRMMLIGGAFLMGILLWITSGLAAWTPGGVTGSAAQAAIACIILHVSVSLKRLVCVADDHFRALFRQVLGDLRCGQSQVRDSLGPLESHVC